MKRIAQLTFHASHNYGSVLQAYALSRQLQLMGYDTEFINLRPTAQRDAYKIITGRGMHRAFHYLLYPALRKRYINFERFITSVLPISEKEYNSTEEMIGEKFDYDAFVCGGDQIFNPACQDFVTAYYLQFLPEDDSRRKIAYSPSFGKTEFDGATKADISRWIKRFDYVSVREQRGAELLESISDKKVTVVCDPVILLDKSEWEKLAVVPKVKKPYILVYFLENNHGHRDQIEYLRKTLNYDVVVLNEYIRDFVKPYRKAYSASPEEFVGLFMNASFIYTNSFHGTAFATIFEKPFISAIAVDQINAKNNNDSRKIDYLQKIGMENRLYKEDMPNKEFLTDIDFSMARERIKTYRDDSLCFLSKALSEDN